MKTFQITLPESFDVASRGMSVTVDVRKMPAELIAKLCLHGLTQKVSDSAASAGAIAKEDGGNAADIGKSMMQKTVDRLEAGEWGAERSAGEPAINRFIREFARANLSDASRKEYAALKGDPAARAHFLWAKYEGATQNVQAGILKGATRLEAIAAQAKKVVEVDVTAL